MRITSNIANAIALNLLTGDMGRKLILNRPGRATGPVSAYRAYSRLNRSRKWRHANTYAEARAMSPYPERPVR
jgi:hypothetical protein